MANGNEAKEEFKDSGKNVWIEELGKFKGKKAIIKYQEGDKIETIEAVVKAVNYLHGNVIVMTEKEKIYIRAPIVLKRVRNSAI